MAPRDQPKFQQTNTTKANTNHISKPTTIKKTVSAKKTINKTPSKVPVKTPVRECRQRTNTAPSVSTLKSKDDKASIVPNNVTRSAKKLSKRKQTSAHSGVPVPEKMKRLEKLLQEADCSF